MQRGRKGIYELAQRGSESRRRNITAQVVKVVDVLVPLASEGIQGHWNRVG